MDQHERHEYQLAFKFPGPASLHPRVDLGTYFRFQAVMFTCTHGAKLLLDLLADAPARRLRACPPRPFRTAAGCLLPGVECALVPELDRIRAAM